MSRKASRKSPTSRNVRRAAIQFKQAVPPAKRPSVCAMCEAPRVRGDDETGHVSGHTNDWFCPACVTKTLAPRG